MRMDLHKRLYKYTDNGSLSIEKAGNLFQILCILIGAAKSSITIIIVIAHTHPAQYLLWTSLIPQIMQVVGETFAILFYAYEMDFL